MRLALTALLVPLLVVPSYGSSPDTGQAGGESLAIKSRMAGDVPYVTGGIGRDQRDAIAAIARDYNLKLVFAEASAHHAFVAGVSVRVVDEAGREVFAATDAGPWLVTRLPARTYRVSATLRGRTLEQTANVVEGRQTQLAFYW